MINEALKKRLVEQVLPHVQTPGQYLGGELNAVRKDRRRLSGTLCLVFPDTYAIGMSHHGLQVLYSVMNRRTDWACERAFAPLPDMEHLLRQHGLPLYSLETFTPLGQFDVVGFTLQHELCYANVLTVLDLSAIPLHSGDRTLDHPLIIAGGPCAGNPEPMVRFIDLFVTGDGEEALPAVCDQWLRVRGNAVSRQAALAEMARALPYAYVPSCYRVESDASGRMLPPCPMVPGVPEVIQPAVIRDLDAVPLPTAPVVPFVECVQDRLAIEIMRGCPWRCRFCQSTSSKRPLRFRRVDTVVAAAWEAYRNTGYNEISLLSLSTSDYPHIFELLEKLRKLFVPLGVSISVPSLRVNEQLAAVSELVGTARRSGLTLAPEAALDDMRRQIGKRITNEDLFEGCRRAFQQGFERVKLYFMCGLPGERPEDLDGIVEMAETISGLRREVAGKPATVVANVSNFVPKPHTPFQWKAMQRREYFQQAHRRLLSRRRMRTVQIKYHDVEASLIEAVFARGDRRLSAAVEWAWRRGARLDSWSDHFRPELWWQALAEAGVNVDLLLHEPYPLDRPLPWDHIATYQGRSYLEREFGRAEQQLAELRSGNSTDGQPR